MTMFTDLLRLVTRHGVAVPPEIAVVFRALATVEGTLTMLCPGFDIVAESRRYARANMRDVLVPDSLRTAAIAEAVKLLPVIRRLPAWFTKVS